MFSPASFLTSLTWTALASLSTSLPVDAPRAACSPYMLLNVRGTGEAPGTFFATRGIIDRIRSQRSGGTVYEVQYPANADPLGNGAQVGVDDITRVIQTGLRDCPAQKYALIGYSQGATVVDRTLRTFAPDSPEGRAIDTVLLMGNPYHAPNKKGNVDENGGTTTAGATGILVLVGGWVTPDAWYETGKVLDICYQEDPICNGVNLAQVNVLGLNVGALLGQTVPQLLKTGQLKLQQLVNSNHLIYPGDFEVVNRASEFVASFLPF